jgi:hypothetical protein
VDSLILSFVTAPLQLSLQSARSILVLNLAWNSNTLALLFSRNRLSSSKINFYLIVGLVFSTLLGLQTGVAEPNSRSCSTTLAILKIQGHVSSRLHSNRLDEKLKDRLFLRFGRQENLRILGRDFIRNPAESLGGLVIEGNLIEHLERDEDLRYFASVTNEITENAQDLAPIGYSAVPSGVVIFINAKGKIGDATGNFHQDGAGLIGFVTLAAENDGLTTRYIDSIDLVPLSRVPEDIDPYTYLGDGALWVKKENIKFAAKNEILYFFGTEGKVFYGPDSAEPLWHAGPVPMYIEHQGSRIAIGVSFAFVKDVPIETTCCKLR